MPVSVRIINIYIVKHLIIYLALAIGIATFVMMAGSFAQVFEMISQDVPVAPLLQFVLYKTPQLLSYTIPMGLLIATMLLFNRLSAENEITALRASGISLLQIVTGPILLAMALSGICFYLQFTLSPDLSHKARTFIRQQSVRHPLALLKAGTFNELFEGCIVYVERKEDNQIFDVHIYVLNPQTGELERDIMASRGEVEVNEERKEMQLTLYNCTIVSLDPSQAESPANVHRLISEDCSYTLEYNASLLNKPLLRKFSHMNIAQLFAHIQLAGEMGQPITPYTTEMHLRAALALAPFSLLIAAIPFGLQISRRETSAGLVGAIALAIGYFGAMMICEGFSDTPEARPALLAWVPNITCQIVGIWALFRKR